MSRRDRISSTSSSPADAIQVWFATIDDAAHVSPLLTTPEQERAARYRFADDQRRSIVARGALRAILGQYLDRDPRSLAFIEGEHGKPALADHSLEFNVSHSGDLIALAFATGTPIGIDVEQVRAMRDATLIAERFFSPHEVAQVTSATNVDDLFFTIWTAKEAVVKALGHGIGAGLQNFSVPLTTPALEPIHGWPEWSVHHLPPPRTTYRAAIATRSGIALPVNVHRF